MFIFFYSFVCIITHHTIVNKSFHLDTLICFAFATIKPTWIQRKQLQTANNEQRQVVVNGRQQTSALLQAMKANMEASRPPVVQQPQPPPEQNKQFVVTPDFVQQSMLIYHPSVIVYNPNCAYPMQNDFIRHNWKESTDTT